MDLQAADFQEVFSTNAVGPFLVVQQFVQQGLLGGPTRSTVVNISSIMSSHADPTISSVTPGGYAYRYGGLGGVLFQSLRPAPHAPGGTNIDLLRAACSCHCTQGVQGRAQHHKQSPCHGTS